LLILDNFIWLATKKGVQKISLNAISEKPLANIYLKGNNSSIESNLQFKNKEGIKLKPEVCHYSSNGQFEYAYRINKNKWIKLPGNIDEINIQSLPVGKFEIELKAIDYLGRDSENTIFLSGYLSPPFYETWWFILIILLLLTVLFFLTIRLTTRKIRQREEEKTQVINSQLVALKAQMNPHFIFNVLNSIKCYIYENNRDKATNYLDDFSDLIRRTLEMSETQYTDLYNEIELTRLYIDLEAMMLDDKFSYDINIQKDIDLQQKIPTLLLQPFIENAFKHGLKNKMGEKTLTITMKSLTKNGIQIEIVDNGIGREASQKIGNKMTIKSKSFAMGAMNKRMNLINSQGLQTIAIQTIDLCNQGLNPDGTKIIIQLKNNYSI
jgi:sensor histidine kinase YesM